MTPAHRSLVVAAEATLAALLTFANRPLPINRQAELITLLQSELMKSKVEEKDGAK